MDLFAQPKDTQCPGTDRETCFHMAWTAGKTALAEAQESLERQDLLAKACDHFIDAIHFAPERPEPYLGMGYLLTLLEDYDSARKYVYLALRLAPNHPEALDLERMLQTCSVVSSTISDLSALCMIAGVRMETINPENNNLDELLHRTETLLYIQLKLLEYETLPQIQIQPEKIAEMSHREQELQAFICGIRQRLEFLYTRGCDVSPLKSYLQQVENLQQKYSFYLKASQDLLEMGKWVRQDFKEMIYHIIQLRMHASAEAIARAEQFEAEMLKRCTQIEVTRAELDPQARAQFEQAIHFQHLQQQCENFQQLLDVTRRCVFQPGS